MYKRLSPNLHRFAVSFPRLFPDVQRYADRISEEKGTKSRKRDCFDDILLTLDQVHVSRSRHQIIHEDTTSRDFFSIQWGKNTRMVVFHSSWNLERCENFVSTFREWENTKRFCCRLRWERIVFYMKRSSQLHQRKFAILFYVCSL